MESLEPTGLNDEDDDETVVPLYFVGLTDKERRFAEEYVKDCNATQAAIRAGYSTNLVSAATIGSRKYRKVQVRAAINALLSELSMSMEEVVHRLSEMARGSFLPFVEPVGRTFMFDFNTDEAIANIHLIKKIKQGQYGIEVELHDAKDALFKVAQIYGKVKPKGEDDESDDELIQVNAYIPDNGRCTTPTTPAND